MPFTSRRGGNHEFAAADGQGVPQRPRLRKPAWVDTLLLGPQLARTEVAGRGLLASLSILRSEADLRIRAPIATAAQ
jgi:hypothetical protein